MTILGFRIDESLKKDLENSFKSEIWFVNNVVDFIENLKNRQYEAVIVEMNNLKEDALINLITKITEFQRKSVILVIGESSDLRIIAGSIKAGAYDYILKPVNNDTVIKIIEKSIKDYRLLAEKVDKKKNTGEKLIGRSKEMVELYKLIGKVANSDLPVLITGEKGTGKTSVANFIHEFSSVSDNQMININCYTYRSSLIEKTLFGYDKENIEGAVETYLGRLEESEGGILHLRNIEALSLNMQSKILYFLEEGSFLKQGSNNPIKSSIRIIASTSENLEDLIISGKFIEELYRKLRVLEINIPALRDRKEDIPFIIDHHIIECNHELNKNIKGISKLALNKMLRYEWPGNVNELKNAIKSAVTLCRGSTILLENLPSGVLGEQNLKKKPNNHKSYLNEWIKEEIQICKKENRKDYHEFIISKVEKELIRQVLEITNGKKIEISDLLGITRNTLRAKMNKYDLE